MSHLNRTKITCFLLCMGLALAKAPVSAAHQASAPSDPAQRPALTAEEIVSHMEEKNREREAALRKFEGTRVYHVKYHGFFGSREAGMVVSVSYTSPNDKEFTIVSQQGSKFVIDHVLKGLLDGEKEAASGDNHQHTALDSRNYDFTLASVEASAEGPQYVLNVVPKIDNKFLYRGKIWVDAKDFAVTRIEAEPAKTPSFWIKKTEVKHRYEKVGDFWLPAENKTESWIRLGGHASLSIEYEDYKITESSPLQPVTSAHEYQNVPSSQRTHFVESGPNGRDAVGDTLGAMEMSVSNF
jgi:hypothetical protein